MRETKWMVPVLQDIAQFAYANGYLRTYKSLLEATAVVSLETGDSSCTEVVAGIRTSC